MTEQYLFLYDGTFSGFLSSVFYSYEQKIIPADIVSDQQYQDRLFLVKHPIRNRDQEARRVWNGIKKKTSYEVCKDIHYVFLSEEPGVEILLYHYIRKIMDTPFRIENDYSDDIVLKVKNIEKKVIREAHRVLMFVRFQKTADDIFFAPFEPLYNILPLTINHFKDRFADQKWIIYDKKRDFGFFFDRKTVHEIKLNFFTKTSSKGKLNREILHEEEMFFQELWKDYYHSINIKERKNLKVHMQFMPKRFWKYLPEKDLREEKD